MSIRVAPLVLREADRPRFPMGLEVKPDLSFPSNRGGFFNDGWVCW